MRQLISDSSFVEQAPPVSVTSPELPSPEINSQDAASSLLLQQQNMNPAMQQNMQQAHQREAEQLQQFPHTAQRTHPQKQTLQQAHAEAQQHFQQVHHAMESPVLPPPLSPAATGIYSMVRFIMPDDALQSNCLYHHSQTCQPGSMILLFCRQKQSSASKVMRPAPFDTLNQHAVKALLAMNACIMHCCLTQS